MLLGSRLHDPGRGGESLTTNCLLEGLEILRLHPPRSQECFDVGLDRRLDRRKHLLEAPFFGRDRAVQSTADQRQLFWPVAEDAIGRFVDGTRGV